MNEKESKGLFLYESVDSRSNHIINLDAVLARICCKSLMSFRAQANIEVSGKRFLRTDVFAFTVGQVIVHSLMKCLLEFIQCLSFVNQAATNPENSSRQKIIRKIAVNRPFVPLVSKHIYCHKYPIILNDSTILRMVPLPKTFLGWGRAQKITSLLELRETKRPCEPPRSPIQSKPSELSTEQSSLEVISDAVGTLVRRISNLSFLVKIFPPLVTNFSNKPILKQFIFVLCVAAPLHLAQADEFADLAQRCAPSVAVDTLRAIVKTESSFNPYAIGVVGGSIPQPKSFHEAMAAIARLELAGANYSVGLGQINKSNFAAFGIDAAKALDACTNLSVAAQILGDCYARAQKNGTTQSKNLHDALSCYYSGNFKQGYSHGYVNSVRKNAGLKKIPSLSSTEEEKPSTQSTLIVSTRDSQRGLIF